MSNILKNICIHVGIVYIAYSIYMKSSDAKASKCHLKFSSKMTILSSLYI